MIALFVQPDSIVEKEVRRLRHVSAGMCAPSQSLITQ
jgi:hypothetical protein